MRSFSLEKALLQCPAHITGTTTDVPDRFPVELEFNCLDCIFLLFVSFLGAILLCFVLEIAYNLYHTQFEVLNCNSFGFQWAANPFDVTCFCVPPDDDNGLG